MEININRIINKVIDKKNIVNPVLEAYTVLSKDKSIPNTIVFMEEFKQLPDDIILENFKLLYAIPYQGTTEFMNKFINSGDLTTEQLVLQKGNLSKFINSLVENGYDDSKHLGQLNSVLENVNNKLNSDVDNILSCHISNMIKSRCLYESSGSYKSDFDIIKNTITTFTPGALKRYDTLAKDISKSTIKDLSDYPNILTTNTKIVLNITKEYGTGFDLICSLPLLLVEKIISFKVSASQLNSFVKLYENEISYIRKELSTNRDIDIENVSKYLDSMEHAKGILYDNYTHRKKNIVEASIGNMTPIVPLYNESVLDDINVEFETDFMDYCLNDDEDDSELLENLLISMTKYYSVCEGKVIDKAVGVSQKIEKGSLKVASKLEDTRRDIKRVKEPLKRSINPFTSRVTKMYDDLKELDKKKRRERIIEDGYKVKIMRIIRSVVISVSTGKLLGLALGPVIGLIGVIGAIAIDSSMDRKERNAIINDLEHELEITKEKLDDAKSEGNKSKKYELMRIENKLQRELDKIKYHLKD